ncbi:hypothetical protein S829_23010 [Salmonella enterica]|uniref:Lysis protein for colicin n=1 Tax=Salmonella houtenae TaxID=59205 RepID=A0A5Y2SFW5_SALHO|nr:hypothetical protein [Salmonella enterica]ECF6074847.1 hypothetical protein [Salmonella enterica subsp. houtenae]EDT6434355.1 hypothetical protein [Salmonella enterica subsp. enterica]EDW6357024.1 hypothetical protein [Salmonella enterica subsp. enterica serovar Sandiego]EBO9790276.1 hypothetical protein [Salmonella enterica]
MHVRLTIVAPSSSSKLTGLAVQ